MWVRSFVDDLGLPVFYLDTIALKVDKIRSKARGKMLGFIIDVSIYIYIYI